MPITMAPPAIIFINTDLTESIIETFTRQLFLTFVMDAATFDAIVAADGYYPQYALENGWRIMVLRPLYDMTNRNLADIVLFAKAGLVSVEWNRVGPPGITLPIDKVYLTALINLNKPIHHRVPHRPDLADYMARTLGQEGIVNDRNFDPIVYYGTDPPYWLLSKGGTKSF
jgi:hypothetical protein